MIIDAVGLFVYVLALRFCSAYDINAKLTAVLIGFGPIILLTTIRYITAFALGLPVDRLIAPSDIVVAIAQTIVAFFIVYKLQQKDDNDLTSWFMVAIAGAMTNYALIPYVVPMITANLLIL